MCLLLLNLFFFPFFFVVLPMDVTGRLETRKKSVENTQEQGRGVMAQGPTKPSFSQGSGLVTYLNSVCIAQPSNLMHLRHCGNTEHVTDSQLLRTSIIHSEFGG